MGLEMKRLNIIDRFDIGEDGKLLVNHDSFQDGDGNTIEAGMGPFDFERRDPEFISYCAQVIWPHAKIYSFAESLKWMATKMFRIEPSKVYGSDEEKATYTQYTWDDIKPIVPPKFWPRTLRTTDKKMSGREFLQKFGDVLRHLNDSCFIDVTMNQIEEARVPLSLIADCRRIDEMKRVRAAGGKIIYLTKSGSTANAHHTEKEFRGKDMSVYCDKIIDNKDMTIGEKNAAVHATLQEWGWLT